MNRIITAVLVTVLWLLVLLACAVLVLGLLA